MLVLAFAQSLHAHEADEAVRGPSGAELWEMANDWAIGDVLFPNLHLHGVGGWSSEDIGELSGGGHDPQRETFSAQAIEPGISLRTKYLEGFANYLSYQDGEGDWDGELEEAFGKIVNIPGGFEVKGGRYLTRFGALNDKHLHGWDFADAELANTRFLGEDGLMMEGAEVSWTLPLGMEPEWTGILSLGYGKAAEHGGHGAEHGHGGEEEVPHEGEESFLTGDALTARAMARYRLDDFHALTGGFSWAGGDNGFGRTSNVFGIDVGYLWRENGLAPGGRALRWRNEVLWREVGAFSQHDEDEDGVIDETFRGSYREAGFHSHAVYTWNAHVDTALRLAWLEGVDDFGQDGRFRISPAVTWYPDPSRRLALRVQYNFDSPDHGDDGHSLWFQLSLALGSSVEVR
jgi:hypothetical protein